MTTRRIGIKALAAEFSIARSVALRYLTEAAVNRAPDRTFSYPEAAAALRARKDLSKVVGHRSAGKAGGRLFAHDVADEPEVDPLDCTPTNPIASEPVSAMPGSEAEAARLVLVQTRAETERQKLRIAQHKLDLVEGKVVARATVEKTLGAVVLRVRTGLLALGSKLAPTLAAEEDPDAVARIIDDEVRRALGSLADESTLVAEVLR